MTVLTRDFGEIEIRPEDVVEFRQPIYGFEDYRKFILLYDDDIGPHFTWLQSLEEPQLCFVLTDPKALPFPYQAEVPKEVAKLLGQGDYECWVISVITEDFSKATVNLKSPLFLNRSTGCAAQTILEGDYPIRCPLFQKEGEAC